MRSHTVCDDDVLPQGSGEVPYESPLGGGEAGLYFLEWRCTREHAAHDDKERDGKQEEDHVLHGLADGLA